MSRSFASALKLEVVFAEVDGPQRKEGQKDSVSPMIRSESRKML